MAKVDLENLVDGLGDDDQADPSQQLDGAESLDGEGDGLVYDASHEGADDEALAKELLDAGVIDDEVLERAKLVLAQSPGADLAEVLIEQDIDELAILEIVASMKGLEFTSLERTGFDDPYDGVLVQRLGVDYCLDAEIVPVSLVDDRATFATSKPDNVMGLEDARLQLKAKSMRVIMAPGSRIREAMQELSAAQAEEVDVDEILEDIAEEDVLLEETSDEEENLEREAAESPVIRYVNYIIQTAVKEGASDIHIEPGDKSLVVRFRIDGMLFEMMRPPPRMAAAITSRLKIMANLDISERRLPQDGRIRCTVQGRKLDLRVSTLPTSAGEKTVMRILDTRSIKVQLNDLGFGEDMLDTWKRQVKQPHGIILVTGPTGSGKTTTLYASLRQMDKKGKNISTVEDPVEYQVEGITQTQTHGKIGMTFAAALKSLLRQDPDVIMVGEIRDMETASTAVQASLTGHLVLSTLHTNDAPSSITRLVNIGIEPFLIGAAVNATLAQRLVRRICPHCKREAELTDDHREFLELRGMSTSEVFEGAGCTRCRDTGYSGRLGLYELLVIDDSARDVIARDPNVTEFRRFCIERGMTTLREDGLSKVAGGQTTIGEVFRVTEATS